MRYNSPFPPNPKSRFRKDQGDVGWRSMRIKSHNGCKVLVECGYCRQYTVISHSQLLIQPPLPFAMYHYLRNGDFTGLLPWSTVAACPQDRDRGSAFLVRTLREFCKNFSCPLTTASSLTSFLVVLELQTFVPDHVAICTFY